MSAERLKTDTLKEPEKQDQKEDKKEEGQDRNGRRNEEFVQSNARIKPNGMLFAKP